MKHMHTINYYEFRCNAKRRAKQISMHIESLLHFDFIFLYEYSKIIIQIFMNILLF